MKSVIGVLTFLFPALVFSQQIDTLSFFSETFNDQRTVYVHLPEDDLYKSEAVQFPVIYILDAQHEWFVNPVLNDISYLQYTHEIPKAIIIEVPLKNRNKECAIDDLQDELPLHVFLTTELEVEIQKYQPNAYRLMIGHSFSASFTLYSYLKDPDHYSAVIAHSPLDELENLVKAFDQDEGIPKQSIAISVGSIAQHKDYYHRRVYDQLKSEYPTFFKSVNLFEANFSSHSGVPIVATPILLAKTFEAFSGRYASIARVDEAYKLIDIPGTADEELEKVKATSRIGDEYYPAEIPEINGLASRYLNSGYNDIGIEIYRYGVALYPEYFDFHLTLYNLASEAKKEEMKSHLLQAGMLLRSVEGDWEGKSELLDEIKTEMEKNGW